MFLVWRKKAKQIVAIAGLALMLTACNDLRFVPENDAKTCGIVQRNDKPLGRYCKVEDEAR